MTILLQGAGIQSISVAPSGPVPLLDLEADTLTPGVMATWPDQSGNGYNFTRAGTADGPIAYADFGDGYPYVEFATDTLTVSHHMLGPDFADNLGSFTLVFIAMKHATLDTGPHLITKVLDGNNDQGWGLDFASNLIDLFLQDQDTNNYRNTYPYHVAPPLEWHVYSINVQSYTNTSGDRDGDSSQVYIEDFGTVTTIANNQPVRLGASGVTGTPNDLFAWAGYVRAVRIYSPALSSSDRETVEAELAARYGITLP